MFNPEKFSKTAVNEHIKEWIKTLENKEKIKMGKMTTEKKKRREKRVLKNKKADKFLEESGGMIGLVRKYNPEFNQAVETLLSMPEKYPVGIIRSEEEEKRMVDELKDMAKKMEPIVSKLKAMDMNLFQ